MMASAFETIAAYHEATKHHFHRYARLAGHMDWANQPNPFRYYEGTERTPLGIPKADPELPFSELFTPVRKAIQPLSLETLSIFLGYSMGLSAWKKAGDRRWSLRINPSSGNLHPTETHLILPPLAEIDGGVFHYFSYEHALERRADLPKACLSGMDLGFGEEGFLVALSTIFWRESWKYGERAFRYCNLDAGHAVAALCFAARLNNWAVTALNGAGDQQIRSLFGFDQTVWHSLEDEVPELICWVSTSASEFSGSRLLPDHLVRRFASQRFFGVPNQLSRRPVNWSAISRASDAIEKPITQPEPAPSVSIGKIAVLHPKVTAAKIIRQRRSAVSYNPRKSIPLERFKSILQLTLPRKEAPPFGVGLMAPNVDLLLFVHRVDDLSPGLYLLARRSDQITALSSQWQQAFLWQRCWPGFPLYRLREGDVTYDAMALSCHQDIAGDSAFAVAMISNFREILQQAPYKYRHLHWECGMIGQVLYLAAEAHGLRGTGIGCFFDDPVHQLLGIDDNTCQTLYHFTIGHPVEDARLETLPAYHHLKADGI